MSKPAVIQQLDEEFDRIATLERRLAQLARLLGGAADESAFWRQPRGLELRSVSHDRKRGEFVVSFRAGPKYRMAASALKLTSPVTRVELDELEHGVVVQLSDGSQTSFSSDLVLFNCEPAYEAANRPRQGEEEQDFGARIRALRLSAGLRAKEVAAASGLAPSNYARLEASKHQPRIETLVRVAKALDVPLAALVSEKR